MNKFIELVKIELLVFSRDYIALFWTFIFPFFILIVFMSIPSSSEEIKYKKILLIEGSNLSLEEKNFPIIENFIEKNFSNFIVEYRALGEQMEDESKYFFKIQFSDKDNQLKTKMIIEHLAAYSDKASSLINTIRLSNKYLEKTDPNWIVVDKTEILSVNNRQKKSETQTVQKITIGLICMTIVSTCLFGFSVVIVQLRAANALKIYHVMPMNKGLFLASFIVSRVIIIVIFSLLFFAASDYFYSLDFDYTIRNIINFIFLVSIGSSTFICIGLLIAARITSVSAANGVINIFYFPLILLSGLFFPISSELELINYISKILPLSEYTEMFSKITFQNDTFLNNSRTLILMFCWAAIPFLISQKKFVWNAS